MSRKSDLTRWEYIREWLHAWWDFLRGRHWDRELQDLRAQLEQARTELEDERSAVLVIERPHHGASDAATIARLRAECAGLQAEYERLSALINTPELDSFLRAVHIEAVHQVERWGASHDRAKRPADWFWLVGYLAGKALHSAISGDRDKALHHCISTAAALYNWHCSIKGVDVRMCPGRSDIAEAVDQAFPGEAT